MVDALDIASGIARASDLHGVLRGHPSRTTKLALKVINGNAPFGEFGQANRAEVREYPHLVLDASVCDLPLLA
jgi:hypothetical protein